jgi:ribosome biogenesis GTPase
VVRLHGGFYFTRELTTGAVHECSRRGRLAKQRIYVGDRVLLEEAPDGKFVIKEVLPRKTVLMRPPVANVQQSAIIMSVKEPEPEFRLLDLFLLISITGNIHPAICLNKIDLTPADPYFQELEAYRNIGFRVFLTSAKTGEGVEDFRQWLIGSVSVLAGPSGVGKSSLLNAVHPGLRLRTAQVNPKTKRGRHVTRTVELTPLVDGGFVVDTPGFTNIQTPDISLSVLADCYPEIAAQRGKCRFNNCSHTTEPDCMVQKAVAEGTIPAFRYSHYVGFASEIAKRERTRY